MPSAGLTIDIETALPPGLPGTMCLAQSMAARCMRLCNCQARSWAHVCYSTSPARWLTRHGANDAVLGAGQALKENFEEELFSYLTEPLDTLQIIIFSLVVSAHAPDEEYIDDHNLKWIQVRAGLPEAMPRPWPLMVHHFQWRHFQRHFTSPSHLFVSRQAVSPAIFASRGENPGCHLHVLLFGKCRSRSKRRGRSDCVPGMRRTRRR